MISTGYLSPESIKATPAVAIALEAWIDDNAPRASRMAIAPPGRFQIRDVAHGRGGDRWNGQCDRRTPHCGRVPALIALRIL